jgi:hypothetical protein
MMQAQSPRRSGRRRSARLIALLGTAVLATALLGPATASAASNIGGGAVSGTVQFNPGAYVPPFFSSCAPTSFNLSVKSDGSGGGGFVLNTAGTEYAGTVNIQGNGNSACESASTGGGNLTLTDVQGTGASGGTLDCANPQTGTTLSGTYLRVYTDVSALLHGTCIVNDHPAAVTFVFKGEFVPTGSGAGISAPISQATFAGPFTVAPL